MTKCSLVDGYKRFGETSCLHGIRHDQNLGFHKLEELHIEGRIILKMIVNK